jgi:hypothetical protein
MVNIERERYQRLWAYYRNPMRPYGSGGGEAGSDRPYRQAQEWGLPSRFTGGSGGGDMGADGVMTLRKEVVIENDIAWRVDTMVDYLFGKPMVIASAAPDAGRREVIGALLRGVLARNGGILFLQQLALLGAVYGFVDVLVKLEGAEHASAEHASAGDLGDGCGRGNLGERSAGEAEVASMAASGPGGEALESPSEGGQEAAGALEAMAGRIRLEIVEPARALPLLSPWDYRVVEAYGQVYSIKKWAVGNGSAGKARGAARWRERMGLAWLSTDGSVGVRTGGPSVVEVLEVVSADRWQRYEDEQLVAEGRNSLGEIPLVHIQNTAVPFEYAGQSDVEGLIPLQDELNIRLSDRANRITMQSFKMYLGKGIDNFTELPVAPGRMWMSDNEQADVVEFGGDGANPSEESHIADIREALDKASGVTPVAAGAIKNKIGRLTSAAALRVTLLALLAKTDRKRTSYGRGIERMCELALAGLDRAGVFHTTPAERRVELHWPSPLPENDLEKLQEAEMKRRLGVGEEVVLRELGY